MAKQRKYTCDKCSEKVKPDEKALCCGTCVNQKQPNITNNKIP